MNDVNNVVIKMFINVVDWRGERYMKSWWINYLNKVTNIVGQSNDTDKSCFNITFS